MTHANARATRLASELRDELARVTIPFDASEHRGVRDAVSDYVGELRSMDWPPEQVIKMVKEIARDAGLTPSLHHEALHDGAGDMDRFLSDLVSWSITEYYNG